MSDPPYLKHVEKTVAGPERISRNSLWVFIGQVGSALFSFAAIFFLTRYLGPEKFGLYSTALSLALMLIPLSDFGFDMYMTRTISTDTSRLAGELSSTLTIKCILALAVWGLMLLCAVLLKYDAALIGYVALLGLSLAIMSVAQSFTGAFRAIRRMRYESLSLLAGRGATALFIILLILMKASLPVIILSYLAGSIILLVVSYYLLRRLAPEFRFFCGLGFWRERFRGALPFGLTLIFSAIYFKIDMVILSKVQDPSWVGFYSSAQNLINGSLMLAMPLVVAIFPAMAAVYAAQKADAHKIFRQGMVFILLLGLPLGIGTALMSGSIIALIYGSQYAPAAALLAIVAWKIPIVYTTLLIGNGMGAVGFQRTVAWVSGINVIFNIVANLIFIPRYGARAAAIITVTTELLGLIQYIFVTRGKLGMNIFPQLARMTACCLAAAAGFIFAQRILGPWAAAVIFAVIYIGLAFALRLISVETIRNLILSRNRRPETVAP